MRLLRLILSALVLFQLSASAVAAPLPYRPSFRPALFVLGGGSGDIINPPITTQPQSAAVVFDINPDNAITSGSNVLSVTDSTANAIVCSGATGTYPVLATNVANGHNALRSTTTNQYLNCGHPTALATAMAANKGWSAMVVFRNASRADTTYAGIFGDLINKVSGSGFAMTATIDGVQMGSHVATQQRSYSPGDPASNVHTFIYSGDAGASTGAGRFYLDGTMWYGLNGQRISSAGTDPLYIGIVSANTGGGVPPSSQGFTGDILRVIVWNTELSAAESWQADAWARVTYGKQLATVGRTFFAVFDGDSQTMGTGTGDGGSTGAVWPDYSMPALVAASLSLQNGQYANVGKPSATMQAGTSSGNNLMDSAARDVDQFHAITGLPIVVIVGEWYNQGGGTVSAPAGVALADGNRLYCTTRKAVDPTVHVAMWTSLASKDRQGIHRDAFNNSLVTNPGNCDAVIPVHTDTNIGVDGALGTPGAPTAVTLDGVHLLHIGTPYHAADVVPYVHR